MLTPRANDHRRVDFGESQRAEHLASSTQHFERKKGDDGGARKLQITSCRAGVWCGPHTNEPVADRTSWQRQVCERSLDVGWRGGFVPDFTGARRWRSSSVLKGGAGGARLLELVSEIVTDEIKAVEDLVRK